MHRVAIVTVVLTFLAGCGGGVLPEPAEAKAIRAYYRDQFGDGHKVTIQGLRSGGAPQNFQVKQGDRWEDVGSRGRCVTATISYPNSPIGGKAEMLFVINGAKVIDAHTNFKRKN